MSSFAIVRQEIKAALNGTGKPPVAERDWLKAEELADLYGLPKTWFEERGRAGEIERTKPAAMCSLSGATWKHF